MYELTAFQLAQRFVGIQEIPEIAMSPHVTSMLRLEAADLATADEVTWGSAFLNLIAWQLRLPRSRHMAARSWLKVGQPVSLDTAIPANDVVILSSSQTDPAAAESSGHVGFFAGADDKTVLLLGGEHGDTVGLSSYSLRRVLGVRRL